MEKLYERQNFVNGAAPALSASTMNKIDKGLDDIDNRVCNLIPADDYEALAEEAKIAAQEAKDAAASAQAIVGIGIATTTTAGIVKPDGTTISVDTDGSIHCINGGGGDYDAELSTTSENAPQNKAVTTALDNISVYVGEDSKLHFVDRTGADSVLPFLGGGSDYGLICAYQGTLPTYNNTWRQAADFATSFYNYELCDRVDSGSVNVKKAGTVNVIYMATPYNSNTTSNYASGARLYKNGAQIGNQLTGSGVGATATESFAVESGDNIKLSSNGRGAVSMVLYFVPQA